MVSGNNGINNINVYRLTGDTWPLNPEIRTTIKDIPDGAQFRKDPKNDKKPLKIQGKDGKYYIILSDKNNKKIGYVLYSVYEEYVKQEDAKKAMLNKAEEPKNARTEEKPAAVEVKADTPAEEEDKIITLDPLTNAAEIDTALDRELLPLFDVPTDPKQKKIFDAGFTYVKDQIRAKKQLTVREMDEMTMVKRTLLPDIHFIKKDAKMEVVYKYEEIISPKISSKKLSIERAFFNQLHVEPKVTQIIRGGEIAIGREEARIMYGLSYELFDLIDGNMDVNGRRDGRITVDEMGRFNQVIDKWTMLVWDGNRDEAIKDYNNAKSYAMENIDEAHKASGELAKRGGMKAASTEAEYTAFIGKMTPYCRQIMTNYYSKLKDEKAAGEVLFNRFFFRLASLPLLAQMDSKDQERILGKAVLGNVKMQEFTDPINADNIWAYVNKDEQDARLAAKRNESKEKVAEGPEKGPDTTPVLFSIGDKNITQKRLDKMVSYIQDEKSGLPDKKIGALPMAAQKKSAISMIVQLEAMNMAISNDNIKTYLLSEYNYTDIPSDYIDNTIRQDLPSMVAIMHWAVGKKLITYADIEKKTKDFKASFANTAEGIALKQEVGDVFKTAADEKALAVAPDGKKSHGKTGPKDEKKYTDETKEASDAKAAAAKKSPYDDVIATVEIAAKGNPLAIRSKLNNNIKNKYLNLSGEDRNRVKAKIEGLKNQKQVITVIEDWETEASKKG